MASPSIKNNERIKNLVIQFVSTQHDRGGAVQRAGGGQRGLDSRSEAEQWGGGICPLLLPCDLLIICAWECGGNFGIISDTGKNWFLSSSVLKSATVLQRLIKNNSNFNDFRF